MSQTLDSIRRLSSEGKIKVSEHGYDELAADGLTVQEILVGLNSAELVEDYPDYPKGPCVLVLQYGEGGRPVHAVWGIPRGRSEPAVLVTAYRPEPARWETDWKQRRK